MGNNYISFPLRLSNEKQTEKKGNNMSNAESGTVAKIRYINYLLYPYYFTSTFLFFFPSFLDLYAFIAAIDCFDYYYYYYY